MSTPRTPEHHHVFTYDRTNVAVWGGPMPEADAKAEARRLSNGLGFVTIWVARYDDPCQHDIGAPSPDLLDYLRSRTPFWQRSNTLGSVSRSAAAELS